MLRRVTILIGAALLLIVVGGAVEFNQTSLTAALSDHATTPVARNPSDEPSPRGGLGNTRADVESAFDRPTGLQGTMTAYQDGKYAVTYVNGRATAILLSYSASPVKLAQARAAARAYLPDDSVFVGTLGAGAGRVADVYRSARLGSKVVPPTPDVPAGQFAVVYETDRTDAVKNVLLIVGRPPPTQ